MNLRQRRPSPICPPGSRRTALSPTWSDPEGSSHNDFVPGRRLPPPELIAWRQRRAVARIGRGLAVLCARARLGHSRQQGLQVLKAELALMAAVEELESRDGGL